MEKDNKSGRGGRRPGAGRPKGDAKLYTFRAGGKVAKVLDPVRGREERKVLSGTIDDMNRRFGFKTVRLAVEDGEADHWNREWKIIRLFCLEKTSTAFIHTGQCYSTSADSFVHNDDSDVL